MLRAHLDGILAWTKHHVSNGAVEGMNNKIKSISHRSFGFRTAENFIAAIVLDSRSSLGGLLELQ
jgi:transposase